MRTVNLRAAARWIVLAFATSTGCVDEGEYDETVEEEESEDEERDACLYLPSSPPATDVTVPSPLNEYYADGGEAGAGCDLHMWKINANPPSHRALTVEFDLGVMPTSTFVGKVWGRQCGGTPSFCGPWTMHTATAESHQVCNPPDHNTPNCIWVSSGEVTLPANNAYTELRIGARNGSTDFEMFLSE